MRPKLTENQIKKIKKEFLRYKNDRKLSTKRIGKKLSISSSIVQIYFKRLFGEEYKETAKRKMAWLTIVDENDIREIFEKYKDGTLLSQLEREFGLRRGSLDGRLKNVIGEEYTQLARKRRTIDQGRGRKNRVSDEIIKNTFEKYKKTRIPVETLAHSIGIEESSLIDRFKRLFGSEYKSIAYNRRDERRVTRNEYELAFEKYRNTNISLIQLSEELGIRISSLAPRFRRMFGDEYRKIALQKQDLIEIDRKGRTAEELAIEYLKLIGLEIADVRKKCTIKNSLKKPDFIAGDTFIEVKNNYVTLEGFGNVKGYNKILSDYLGKNIMNDPEIILKNGMIISFSGFSPAVRNQAPNDRIKLVGPKEIEETFRKNNKIDLIDRLTELRGLL